ncbi:hypothetical protein HC752_09975 [Vibrio sp. S9_S30]|uniref:cysteine dioxygenase n=1 Tax=Vibrio sp. S9_S30 TaxID=2720226 RepID=UPI0016809287|nr:cysteine dioxygenase family protein [Vibrio sp. S9_S30]MBD1557269.1 hypothetical protein [Vibrio sp. S9_S30]
MKMLTELLSAPSSSVQPICVKELISHLDQSSQPLSLPVIRFLLEHIRVDDKTIEELSVFDRDQYHRHYLYQSENVEVLILGWLNGQRSRIHDHQGSNCGVKVLKGEATETHFKRVENGHILAISSAHLERDQITSSYDNQIHQISNLQPDGQDLVTLHIYSPPLSAAQLYSLESNKIETMTQKQWAYEI